MSQTATLNPEAAQPAAKAAKGHPKGLYVLFATEMWERYNYYGMRAILVLFMTKALLFDKAFASNLYGSYTSLVYLTPLVGGYISDRYWGNKRSIILGGLVMALGEFVLFFCASLYKSAPDISAVLFFTGLGLMIAGNGFFKPNISSMVGQLYPKGDRRSDAAYTIFYMGINVGGAIGPFICGLVGDTGNPADFKWAFLVAGIGMLLSVVVQRAFQAKYVKSPEGVPLGNVPADSPKKFSNPVYIVAGLIFYSALLIGMLYIDANVVSYLTYLLIASVIFIAFLIFSDKSLNNMERQRIGVIFIVAFFVIFFWSAFEQAGASLTFFAEEQTQRDLGFFTVPASWFQSLNSVFVVLFAPVFAWLWLKLGKREPTSPFKMAMGLGLLAIGYLWIAFGVKDVQPGIKVSMIWLTGMYALHTWGELCLSPIGLSLVNKLAPFKFASLLMAVWFLANAAANKLAGVLSALYPEAGKTTNFMGYHMTNLYDFFMLFVGMAGVASLILFFLTKLLKKMMHVEAQ
ncbi:peptide ABC transporter [Niastella yeongjuensis]|uniref:Peptide ABC transporter n=1 Tax=Niastella yeongjuensis TaxID=354355 RepID=A0A1V9EXT8_9BACT|nr:peptide MFS transporter [Niastella yeongjuensis]OQP50919.1 peptide ABC transporter [Niastella yeongjuensis]SEN11533.1 proton-dependent oligopeptide transporter, POT family [Niastella yeongjuensis]